MSLYKHLTLVEREKLLFFSAKGYTVSEISRELGRNKSTISRELRRNRTKKEYIPALAQEKYEKRRRSCRRKLLLRDPEIYAIVKEKFLEEQWSPEQISARLALEQGVQRISYNTIYRGIYAGMFDTPEERRSAGNRGARRKLRRRGKPRRGKNRTDQRGNYAVDHEISERPAVIERRERIGDFESDTMEGKKGRACLVTHVDRKSRFLVAGKVWAKTGTDVADKTLTLLKGMPVKSLTTDHGTEFCQHRRISQALNVPVYFALPHHPWQRGSNENTNGLLREYFPKKTDLTDRSDDYVQAVVDKLNRRPRKCLGWRTPFEVFFNKVLHLT